MLKDEEWMDRDGNVALAEYLATREQQERVEESDERLKATEAERLSNRKMAVSMMEAERKARMNSADDLMAKELMDRKVFQKKSLSAMDDEKERRVKEADKENDSRNANGKKKKKALAGVFEVLGDSAASMERKTNERMVKIWSEAARKEKMDEIAKIDAEAEKSRQECRNQVLKAVEQERSEKIEALKEMDNNEIKERTLSACEADAAMDDEQMRRIKELGQETHRTALSQALLDEEELQRKANRILVKHLVEGERNDRIAELKDCAIENERQRTLEKEKAIALMEQERQDRIRESLDDDDDSSKEARRREAIAASEEERQRRMSSDDSKVSPLKNTGVFEALPAEADRKERNTYERLVKVWTEEARREKIAAIAAIDEKAKKAREDSKIDVLKAIELERAEQIQALKFIEADAKRERALSATRANKAMEAERAERLKTQGETIHPTSLATVFDELKHQRKKKPIKKALDPLVTGVFLRSSKKANKTKKDATTPTKKKQSACILS